MTIQEKVAEKIVNCGELVEQTVVDKLAEIEITRRVDIIMKGIQTLEKLEKEFKKIEGKKDVITYDEQGNKTEMMSKQQYDNSTDSYNKLSDLIKNAGNIKEGSTESTE